MGIVPKTLRRRRTVAMEQAQRGRRNRWDRGGPTNPYQGSSMDGLRRTLEHSLCLW